MELKNDKKSLIMLISSMLIFGTIGIFRRYIPISSSLLASFRGFLGSIFLVLVIIVSRRKISIKLDKKKLILLILVGAFIGFNWIFLFEAYNYTSVATATLCYYMEPTIVLLLSPVFFKEKLTLKRIVCAAVGIIGMVFVSGIIGSGSQNMSNIKGVIYGLIAAALYSTVVILNKKLSDADVYLKTTIELFSAAIVLVPYILLTEDFTKAALDLRSIILLLVVGLFHTGVAYAMYFGSLDGLKAQSVALLSYIDPVTALILSVLILKEQMSLLGIIGAVMILAAAFIGEK